MKKIAIIGASYLQLPAVLKAKELGFEVHCFAWEDGAVCASYVDFFYPISILERDKILECCQRIPIDGIVTLASDIAVLTVNYVANKMRLVSNSDAYSLLTTNKYLMRECFTKNLLPSPKYMLVNQSQEYDIDGFKFPVIVKPTDRSGSRGVEKVLNISDLPTAINRAVSLSFSKEAIIEEFIDGREVSVEAISFQGRHYILAVTDKVTTGEPYFVELEHHQPSSLALDIIERIKEIVFQALSSLHIEYGASHTELKISDDEQNIKIIEVGARMGGDFIGSDLVCLSTGYDFLKAAILVAMGIFEEPVVSKHDFSGVYFLSQETLFLKSVIENKNKFPQIVKAEIIDENIRPIACSGDRSGYLIYKSNKRFFVK